MVAGPLRGDCGREEPRSPGRKGRTAMAWGASSRSPGPRGYSGERGCWKVGLGGTEMRCWICCEDEDEEAVVAEDEEPLPGGPRGQAGAGRLGLGRGGGSGGGTSLRRSRVGAEGGEVVVWWEP